jgi:periplasmic protein TonB
MQNTTGRTSFSLVLSTLLHGSVIAMVALGPAFIPGLTGDDRSNKNTVEFSVQTPEQTQSTISDIKPVVVTAPAPVAQPAVKKIAAKPKTKPTVLPTKAEVAQEPIATVPETIEPQPIVAAEDVVEQDTAVTSSEEPSSDNNFKPVEEAQEEVVAEKQEEVIAAPVQEPAPEAAPQPTAQAEAPIAEKAESAGAAGSAKPEVIEVTQTYLGLQQMPGNKPPTYSREMRLQKMQGRGQLVYYVTKEGRVDQIRLTKSTGSPTLDKAAMDSFSKYTFVPGQEGYTVHDFEFSLKGPAVSDAGRLRTTLNSKK